MKNWAHAWQRKMWVKVRLKSQEQIGCAEKKITTYQNSCYVYLDQLHKQSKYTQTEKTWQAHAFKFREIWHTENEKSKSKKRLQAVRCKSRQPQQIIGAQPRSFASARPPAPSVSRP